MCRLRYLHTVSIKLEGSSAAGELDPMLCQLHMHATGLRSLDLRLNTGYSDDAAWVSLGRMVSLTSLALSFGDKVRTMDTILCCFGSCCCSPCA
jgi:hypothetical protein